MRAFLLSPLAGVLALSLFWGGAAFGRSHAPKPPAPPQPAYQQVAYSGLGLVATLQQNGYSIADMTFEGVTTSPKVYVVRWLITGSDNATSHWVVKTNRRGIVESIRMVGRPAKPQAS